jgi:hypothetical protein
MCQFLINLDHEIRNEENHIPHQYLSNKAFFSSSIFQNYNSTTLEETPIHKWKLNKCLCFVLEKLQMLLLRYMIFCHPNTQLLYDYFAHIATFPPASFRVFLKKIKNKIKVVT